MDEAIISYVRRQHNLLIGEITAERIKMTIGAACAPDDGGSGEIMEIRGRDLTNGVPREITLTEKQIAESLVEPVGNIINAIKTALESAPPELSSDIVENGIVLSGGGALLKNLDLVIRKITGLNVHVAQDPLLCVINGIGKTLNNFRDYRGIVFKQS
jgi:rod shape-determining protein MreB